jgi:hypothetical protein
VRRLVRLLDDIEARHTGFLNALTGVLDGGFLEGLDAVGFHVNMNMHDQHTGSVAGFVQKPRSDFPIAMGQRKSPVQLQEVNNPGLRDRRAISFTHCGRSVRFIQQGDYS